MTGLSAERRRSTCGRSRVALIAILAAALLTAGCSKETPAVNMNDTVGNRTAPDGRPVLRVAIGSMVSPKLTRDYYQELIELLAGKLGRRAVFSQRRTYAEVNALVAEKEVDVAFVCAGPYVRGHKDFGMELLVVPVVRGQKIYYAYILAHRDSAARSLADLRGKRFAFTDPDSHTGYVVPTYMLARNEEKSDSFFSETFYSRSHDNSIQAVAEKQADGASVNSLIWEFMNAIDPSVTSQTRILEKSPPYGMPPVVVHPDLPGELKTQLRAAFLALHEDEKAARLLKRLQIDRFSESNDAAYDTVREARRSVDKLNKDDE